MRHAAIATMIGAGFLYACAAAPERAAGDDLAIVREQLDRMWGGLTAAMTAGDTAALARFYVDSATFAETGLPTTHGRAAILAATAGVFACCVYRESRQHIERTETAGSLALQFGTYRDVIEPKGQAPVAFYGRFDAVLERDSTDTWRVRRLVVIRDSSRKLPPGR